MRVEQTSGCVGGGDLLLCVASVKKDISEEGRSREARKREGERGREKEREEQKILIKGINERCLLSVVSCILSVGKLQKGAG